MSFFISRISLIAMLFFVSAHVFAGEALWKAGVAKAIITPEEPLWMSGYGYRNKPAEGKLTDLWIKTLALEDAGGHRAIILTSDISGIPQTISAPVYAALKEKYGLEPDQVMLTASHTHCGPVLRHSLYYIYALDDHQRSMIERYSSGIIAKIIETTGRALSNLAPARLAAGEGTTGFAVNRRNNAEKAVPGLIARGALKGPVDHAVPVLGVFLPNGSLKAVLFGYACHNTVLDIYKWCGDYAGFAQIELERSHPGAVAMFFMGCGADQNPLPRRRLEIAVRYGNMLASAVEEALLAPPKTLPPELRTAMEMVTLDLGTPPTEAELEKKKSAAPGGAQRWAAHFLEELKAGRPFIRTYSYPVQVWRFGNQQLMIALGGEPVVDYALRFKQEFGPQTWVAGYCNDVMAYIPSARVLKEGGYEGGEGLVPYGLPAYRWGEDIEELICRSAGRLVERSRR